MRVLGALEVDGIEPSAVGRRQVRTLLRILAVEAPHPVATDTLIDRIWGDDPPGRAAEQVAVLASRLRAVVGADRVERTDAGYALHADWTDLAALEEYAAEATRRLEDGAPGAARAAAAAGLALLRGPLLADEPDPWWAQPHRARVEATVARLARTGAAAAMAAGDWRGAADAAHLARLRLPHDEDLLRTEMEALARAGSPAAALSTYAAARAVLAEDLGVSPDAATEALHTAILQGHVPGGPAAGAPAAPPGRGPVLDTLDRLLADAGRGRGGLCVVEGEAGIGKSTVLAAWRERARAGGAAAVDVAATELGRALPLQPLLDLLEALVRDAGSPDAALGDDARVLRPLLGTSHRQAPQADLGTLADSGAGQAVLFAAILAVLRRRAESTALAVTVDDLHFADASTMAWLGYAARRLDGSGVAIVAARRVEEGTALPGVPVVDLGPLDLDATTEVVGAGLAVALHRRSGGHPLFLVELASADPTGVLPGTIRDAVRERCARAGPAGPTLQAAAVIGPTVDLDLLAAVTGTGPRDLLDHLEEGVRRRLLVEDGPVFAFRHLLLRDALAATMSGSRAAFLHREAARALAARDGADPVTVAHHAREGGDPELASRMLVRASRTATARFDHQEALRLLDDAVALDDTAAARLERARVLLMAGDYGAGDADVDAAARLGAGGQALEVAAWSAHLQRRFADALRLADEGAATAGDPDVQAGCSALGGWVSLVTGDLDGAARRLEAAGPGGSAPLAGVWRGWLLVNRGDPERALRHLDQAGGAPGAGDRYPHAYALMARALAAGMAGRPDVALAAVDALELEIGRTGAHRWRPRPLNLRGWVLRNLGAGEEGDELTRAAVEAARAAGLAEPLANGLLDLATSRLLGGDPAAAAALVDEAAGLGDAEQAFGWRHRLRGRLLRARADLAAGAPAAAAAGAAALAADAAAVGAARYEVQARLVAATACAGLGDPVDLDQVEARLDALDRVAGLEGWWITAEVAAALKVDRWADRARLRVGTLLPLAGPYRDHLAAFANRRLS